jgi:hypothetical protein
MQTIRASGPAMSPIIPPVSNLVDFMGQPITLDCDVLVNRFREGFASGNMRDVSWGRARVVGIGDGGLPGREIIKIRPHGSTYIHAAGPEQVEVHTFDEYAWLAAETAAAHHFGDDRADAWGSVRRENRGKDLTKCLFGGFYFEPFQHYAAGVYVKGRSN